MMGATHVENFGRLLQLEAKGKYCVIPNQYRGKNAEDHPDRKYDLVDRKSGKHLAGMTAETLPGCCGVVVLYYFSGKPEDIVQLIHFGEAAAKRAKYGAVLLSLRTESVILDKLVAARSLFRQAEEYFQHTFLNGKTDHSVTVLIKNLRQEAKPARPVTTEGD